MPFYIDNLVYCPRNSGVPETPDVCTISFLNLHPDYRSQGIGRCVVAALEDYAVRMFGARRLRLVVRDYNPGAIQCYANSGFRETGRDGTLITMEKRLPGKFEMGQPAGAS